MAVRALDCLAHLQFCRMRLSAYSALLQAVLTAAASSPMARALPAAGREMFCISRLSDVCMICTIQ